MNNLQALYDSDLAFADIVDEACAAAIGTTSTEFAREWLAQAANEQKPVGDVSRENLRVEIAHLEARVEQMRMQLGAAADYAGAILRVCMDCNEYAVVDGDGEVVA